MVQITRNGRKVLQLSRLFKQRLSLLCISPAPLFFFFCNLFERQNDRARDTHTHMHTHRKWEQRDLDQFSLPKWPQHPRLGQPKPGGRESGSLSPLSVHVAGSQIGSGEANAWSQAHQYDA